MQTCFNCRHICSTLGPKYLGPVLSRCCCQARKSPGILLKIECVLCKLIFKCGSGQTPFLKLLHERALFDLANDGLPRCPECLSPWACGFDRGNNWVLLIRNEATLVHPECFG